MAKSTKKAEPGVNAMAATMMAANPMAAKAWMDIMAESTRFVSERLQKDIEAQKAMLSCNNAAEVVQVQSEFFQKAIEEYTAEAHKMFEIMTGAASEAVKDAKSGHKRSFDDVPV